MLKRMDEYYDSIVDTYEKKQLKGFGVRQYYKASVEELPIFENANILDVGVGTGLELEEYLKLNPTAKITAIDISRKMLLRVNEKFPDHQMQLILGNFYDIPLHVNTYDGAIASFSMHYYTKEEKIYIYKKIYDVLRDDAVFVVSDIFAHNPVEEKDGFKEFKIALKEVNGDKKDLFAFDTPLTITDEIDALKNAGFKYALIITQIGKRAIIKAKK